MPLEIIEEKLHHAESVLLLLQHDLESEDGSLADEVRYNALDIAVECIREALAVKQSMKRMI